MARYGQMQQEHPEVSLFYTAEGAEHHIVFLKDGTVEKYGYSGGPDVTDMEKKYGTLPGYMTHPVYAVNAGYLARWESIGAQAEKTFHTTNADVRGFVFPGDSRVIAIPISGKPVVYDMDNAAAKERTAFEKLYGPLPDCVPAAGGNTDMTERGVTASVPPAPVPGVAAPAASAPAAPSMVLRNVVRARDTVPVASRPAKVTIMNRDSSFSNVLFVVDGVQRPDFTKDSITNPSDIESVDVLKGDEALRYYGEKGAHGVIVITTKAFSEKHPPVKTVVVTGKDNTFPNALSTTDNPIQHPLYVIDGKEMGGDAFKKLNPDDIQSISVLKDERAVSKYGDKGRGGVIEITLKKKTSSFQPVITTDTKDGQVSIQADTIKAPRTKVVVVSRTSGN